MGVIIAVDEIICLFHAVTAFVNWTAGSGTPHSAIRQVVRYLNQMTKLHFVEGAIGLQAFAWLAFRAGEIS